MILFKEAVCCPLQSVLSYKERTMRTSASAITQARSLSSRALAAAASLVAPLLAPAAVAVGLTTESRRRRPAPQRAEGAMNKECSTSLRNVKECLGAPPATRLCWPPPAAIGAAPAIGRMLKHPTDRTPVIKFNKSLAFQMNVFGQPSAPSLLLSRCQLSKLRRALSIYLCEACWP